MRRARMSAEADIAAFACCMLFVAALAAGEQSVTATATHATPTRLMMASSCIAPPKLPAADDPHKVETVVDYRRISIGAVEEVAMTSGMRQRIAALTLGIALVAADAALASQGPGTSAGTASSLTQLAMAILVYGASALIVGAGLIGALRK